jgi:hypothetical protein
MRCVAAHDEVDADEAKVERLRARHSVTQDMVRAGHDRGRLALQQAEELVRAGMPTEALHRLDAVPCWLRGPGWHDLRRSLLRKSLPPPDDHPTLPPPPA